MEDAPPDAGAPPASAIRHFRRLLSGELANKGLRFAAAAVLARALTPSDFGLFNIGIAVSGIVVTLASLGLSEIATREIARDRALAPGLAGRVLVLRALSFAALAVPGVVAVHFAWAGHDAFFVAVAAMTLAMCLTGEWFARGLERMRLVALGTAAGGLAAVAGSVVVLLLSGSAVAAIAAFAVAEALASAIYWTSSRTRRPRLTFHGTRLLLRAGAPLAVSALAVYSYYANVDTVILGVSRSTVEAGEYSAAYRLFLAFNIVAIFGAYAQYPLTARRVGLSPEGLATETRRFLSLLGFYGACVVGAAESVGRPLLGLLFGARFRHAGEAYVLLCLSTSWYCVGYPYGYNLVALGAARRYTLGAVCAGVTGLVLDLILIPPYGMAGAASATLVAIVAGSTLWFRPWQRKATTGRRLMGALSALTASGVVALAVPGARIGIGAATLAVGALGLGRAAATSGLRSRA